MFITTCTRCGCLYEARSEEAACSPGGLCPPCFRSVNVVPSEPIRDRDPVANGPICPRCGLEEEDIGCDSCGVCGPCLDVDGAVCDCVIEES
jgi:hypothetical protein